MTAAQSSDYVLMNENTHAPSPPEFEAGPLARSADRKILAGVCGGLEEHFDINVWWFRVGFIVLAVFGFAGVALYALAWLLMPRPYGETSVASGWMEGLDVRDTGTMIGVGLIALATLIVLSNVLDVSTALVFAFVLAVAGFMLYRGDIRPPAIPPRASRPTGSDDTDDAESGGEQQPESEGVTVASGASVAVATRRKPARERRERPPKSMLGRLTMATLLVVVSAMSLFELAGTTHFQPLAYAAAAMVVVAGGLLVGAVVGRARWLFAIGLMLLPLLVFTSLLPSVDNWSVGTSTNRPLAVGDVSSSYSLGIGELTIDLRELNASELAAVGRIEAAVLLGELTVLLPARVGAVVETSVGMGAVEIFGKEPIGSGIPENCLDAGFVIHECEELSGDVGRELGIFHDSYWNSGAGIRISSTYEVGEAPRDLILDLQVGAGVIVVRRTTTNTHESRG